MNQKVTILLPRIVGVLARVRSYGKIIRYQHALMLLARQRTNSHSV